MKKLLIVPIFVLFLVSGCANDMSATGEEGEEQGISWSEAQVIAEAACMSHADRTMNVLGDDIPLKDCGCGSTSKEAPYNFICVANYRSTAWTKTKGYSVSVDDNGKVTVR